MQGGRLRFSTPQGNQGAGPFGKARTFAPSHSEPDGRKDRQQMLVGFVMLAGAVLLFYVLLGQPTVATGGNRPQQAQLEQLELELKKLQKQVVPVPPVASGQAHLTSVPKAAAPLYTQPVQPASPTGAANPTEATDPDVCIVPTGNWDHTCIVGKTVLEGPCTRAPGQTKRCILKAKCKNSADEVVEAGFEYNAGDSISLNNMDGRLCRQGGQFECGVSRFYTLCPVERPVTTQPYSWGNINNAPPTVVLPSPPVAPLKVADLDYEDDDTDTDPRRRRDPPPRHVDDDEQFEYRGNRRDRDREVRRDRDWEHPRDGRRERGWEPPRPRRSAVFRGGEDDDTRAPVPRRHRHRRVEDDVY